MNDKQKTKLSAGAKKDIVILFFAKAILETSFIEDLGGNIPRDKSDNKMHKINKKIDKRIDSIIERINATINSVLDYDLAMYVKSKNESRIFPALQKIAHYGSQLETFGLYILLTNFCERDKPLHDIFKEYTNADVYFDDIELIKKTNITEDDEGLSMNIAYQVVKYLRG